MFHIPINKVVVHDVLRINTNILNKKSNWIRFTSEEIRRIKDRYNFEEDFPLANFKFITIQVTNVPAGKYFFFNLIFPENITEIDALLSCIAIGYMVVYNTYLYCCSNLDKNDFPKIPELRVRFNHFPSVFFNESVIRPVNVEDIYEDVIDFFRSIFFSLVSKYISLNRTLDLQPVGLSISQDAISKIRVSQEYTVDFILD